ncbi:hypothetical protein PHYC_01914 [Phycisphaerales bacterium]|nr:hypothetical protein PHYC_01914 [Phycisphaerales bacterium]
MGILRTKWTDAKKHVGNVDSLFEKGLGRLLDTAESSHKDFKKWENDLEKMVKYVFKVQEDVGKADTQIKAYKGVIAATKAKPAKGKAVAVFMDREKAVLTKALNEIQATLKGYKDEVSGKKLPTPDEIKAFRGKHTISALKTAGL